MALLDNVSQFLDRPGMRALIANLGAGLLMGGFPQPYGTTRGRAMAPFVAQGTQALFQAPEREQQRKYRDLKMRQAEAEMAEKERQSQAWGRLMGPYEANPWRNPDTGEVVTGGLLDRPAGTAAGPRLDPEARASLEREGVQAPRPTTGLLGRDVPPHLIPYIAGMGPEAGSKALLDYAMREPPERYETVRDPFGLGGVGQRETTTGKITGYQASTKAETTNAQRDAKALGLTPGTPEYQKYIRERTLKPGVSVNLADPTTTKIADKAYESADTQRNLAGDADLMLSLLDQGLDTNALRPIGTKLAGYLRAIGMEVDEDLPMAEAFRAMSNRAALRLRNPASGLGLTGNTSDRDVRFLKEATAGLGNTREANYILLIVQRSRARREADLSELKADHILENGNLKGYHDKRRQFIENTPLLSPEDQARIQELAKISSGSGGGAPEGKAPSDMTDEELLRALGAEQTPGLDPEALESLRREEGRFGR